MRKSIFLTFVLSLCMADFGAFAAAPARGGRGTTSASSAAPAAAAPMAARAGNRQKMVGTAAPKTSAAPAATTNGGVAARAGKKQTVAKPQVSASSAAPSTGKPMAARAGATQKVIQTGSKVATATTNTAVPQECQDAFFGCMDSFCMLDNASGGRCQCSDRITDLDKALEEILKLDEKTYLMATEGVERLKMGEAEEQIMARAQAAADKVSIEEKKAQNAEVTKNKVKQLDLSAWNTSIFDEDDDDDIFDTGDSKKEAVTVENLMDKKGDDLYKAAAKMCVTMVPEQCTKYSSMVQLVYGQRIKSDCIAYENSLKQQKNASQQKLQTAQKALRDAALEEFNDQNKYADLGSCVGAFDKCMQTTAGCGTDYTGCVADDTILTMGTDGSKGQATSASVKTSASAIGISANTLAMLTDKAPMCESVLKQCQKVRSGVWNAFLKMVVPTLKAAEVNAEENRRMNCVGNIVDCFTKACAAQWPNQESAEYDMCLSNPDIVSNLCQTQINKCSTFGTGDQVMEYVKAKLQAMRVDACTNEVKTCLQSENNCGPDYLQCVGLDKDTIVKMCTNSATNYKLMACQSKFSNNQYEVQNYVAQVAQGIILNMDNSMLTACEEAGKKAMQDFCGSDTSCNSEKADASIAFTSADAMDPKFAYTYCSISDKGIVNYNNCKVNATALTANDYTARGVVGWQPTIVNQVNFSCFQFINGSIDVNSESVISLTDDMTEEEKMTAREAKNVEKRAIEKDAQPRFVLAQNNACKWGTNGMVAKNEANRIADILTAKVKNILGKIETDRTVQQCVMGRDFKGITTYVEGDNGEKAFDDMWTMKSTSGIGKGVFPNLMGQYRNIVADAVLQNAAIAYNESYDKFVAENEEKAEKNLADQLTKIEKDIENAEKAKQIKLSKAKISCANQNSNAATNFNNADSATRYSMQQQTKNPNLNTVAVQTASNKWNKWLGGAEPGKYYMTGKSYSCPTGCYCVGTAVTGSALDPNDKIAVKEVNNWCAGTITTCSSHKVNGYGETSKTGGNQCGKSDAAGVFKCPYGYRYSAVGATEVYACYNQSAATNRTQALQSRKYYSDANVSAAKAAGYSTEGDNRNKFKINRIAEFDDNNRTCSIKETKYECDNYDATIDECKGFYKKNPATEAITLKYDEAGNLIRD